MMSSSDENECPLCMEPLEVDDINFFPCTCQYQVCRFCWHRIRTDENGLCPACRKPYSENPATFKPLSPEEFQKIKTQKKKREIQRKRCGSDNRKHLGNLRVVQRNLVFAVGLSPRLADPDVLKKQDYFGKFGKIVKVVMNHSSSYAGNQQQGPSASAYITFAKAEDALKAIHSVNNVQVDGRTIKTCLGTTKYCSMFLKYLPCSKMDCMYLHEIGDEAASFTKEDMNQGKHTEYEKKLYEIMMNQINTQANVESTRKPVAGLAGASAESTSASDTFLVRPPPGSSPIEIPVLPAKKTKKRGKEKKTVEENLKVKVLALGASSERAASERRSVSSETSSAERGADESGSDCGSTPPVATSSEEFMARKPASPSASPTRSTDALVDECVTSSGYTSGSSVSSSLQNFASLTSCLAPVISSDSCLPNDSLPSSSTSFTPDVVTSSDVVASEVVTTTSPSEMTGWMTSTEHELNSFQSPPDEDDDLGFDPFAETQKAFAEILNDEAAEAANAAQLRVGDSSENSKLSVPPGFGNDSGLNLGSTHNLSSFTENSVPETGSKFLPFLLRNRETPPSQSLNHPDHDTSSPVGKLLASLSNLHNNNNQNFSQTHLGHQQHSLHSQQMRHQHQTPHQLHQHFHHRTVEQNRHESLPVLSFLRSRGYASGCSDVQDAESAMNNWQDWESSLRNMFPSGAGAKAGPPGFSGANVGGSSLGQNITSKILDDCLGPQHTRNMGGGGDWQDLDPAIVSTSRHIRHDSGRHSPPSWLLPSLEQLTADCPSDSLSSLQRFQLQHHQRQRTNLPPGLGSSSWMSQAPPGLAQFGNPPPGFAGGGSNSSGGGGIPHSFQNPFSSHQASHGFRGLPQDIFADRRALES